MKLKLLSLMLIIALILTLPSCIVTSRETHVSISCDQFRDNPTGSRNEFTIKVGDKVYAELCSNPTTGFKWSYEMSGDPSVKEEDYDFIESENDLTGSPSIEKWTFEGVEKGTARIMMEYSQPWDGGIKKEWIYQITITVE
ncbi:MAG: protease inhibitor I42 family protein [Dehalococcoidales bacterium]|nr:MAG: protease inhibitor I42 family protein [Dehalococcoidales bacterium]